MKCCSIGIVLALLILGGCEVREPVRHVPMVEVINDVEIATLPRIPTPFDPDTELEFRVVQVVRTVIVGVDDPLVYDPRAVLPLRGGDLLVHDPTADQPLVLIDPEAQRAITRFASTGQGPGELGAWLHLAEAEDGTLIVLDATNRQVHRYSRQGQWISSRRLALDAPVGKTLIAPSSKAYLVEVLRQDGASWHRELARVDFATGEAQPLLRLPDPSPGAEPGRIQRGRVVWAALRAGVVSMWSDQPIVLVYNYEGTLVREIRLPLTRRNISEADIQEQIEHYGEIARSLRPGTTALTNELYAVGDSLFAMFLSGLWRGAEDPHIPAGQILWRLFTIRGEYVGAVPLPEDFRHLGAGNGTVWARVLDESGYPVIQELEVVRRRDDAPQP